MPEIAARHADRLRLVALVHHPLGYETGLEPGRVADLVRSEREALAAARAVLVTSETTRRSLIEAFGVHPGHIGVAPPGTDPAPLAVGSGGPSLQLLAVGSIIPRKGFPALAEALAGLADLPWKLTIVGSMEHAPEETTRLQATIDGHGLTDRVLLAGELDAAELAKLYRATDLMVSASTYEGFGMALAEGLAHGLPIVAIAGGAVADWLDPGAAVLVPGERPGALREALAAVLTDPRLLDPPQSRRCPRSRSPADLGRYGSLRRGSALAGDLAVSAFSSDWLALREPADARARDLALLRLLAGWAALGGRSPSSISAAAPAPTAAGWRRGCLCHSTGAWSRGIRR